MADEIDKRPASAGSRVHPVHATEDDDGEESEIAADAPTPALPTAHPLEHSWTLWFDNPQGKKQAGCTGELHSTHPQVEDDCCTVGLGSNGSPACSVDWFVSLLVRLRER